MRKSSLRAPTNRTGRRDTRAKTSVSRRKPAPRRNTSRDTASAATNTRERKRAPSRVRAAHVLGSALAATATAAIVAPSSRETSPIRVFVPMPRPMTTTTTTSSFASALFTPLPPSSSSSPPSSACRSTPARVADLSTALSPAPRSLALSSLSSLLSPTNVSSSARSSSRESPSDASSEIDGVALVDRHGAAIPHRVLVEWLVEFQHKRLVACGYETGDRPAYDPEWVRAQSDSVIQDLVRRLLAHTPDARVNFALAVDAIARRLETRRETERRECARNEHARCTAALDYLVRTKRSVAGSFSSSVRANARVTDRCDLVSSIVQLDHAHRLAWIVFKRNLGCGGGDDDADADDDDDNVGLWRMPVGAAIRRAAALAKTRADDALLAQLVYWQDRATEDAEERRTKTARCAIRALVAQTRERLPVGTACVIPLAETWTECAPTRSESPSVATDAAPEPNDSVGGARQRSPRRRRRRAAKKGRRSSDEKTHATEDGDSNGGGGQSQDATATAASVVRRHAHRVISARVCALHADESTARLTLETSVDVCTERVVPGVASSPSVVRARHRVVYRPNFDADGDGAAFWEAHPIEFSSGRRSDAIRSRLRAADIGDDGDDSLMFAVLARNVEQAMRHRANYHSCVAALVAQYAVGLFPVDGRDGPPPPQLESGSGNGDEDGTDEKREAKIETVADRTSVDAERRRGRGRPRGVRNSRSRKRKPASSDDDDDDDDESSDYDNVSD